MSRDADEQGLHTLQEIQAWLAAEQATQRLAVAPIPFASLDQLSLIHI